MMVAHGKSDGDFLTMQVFVLGKFLAQSGKLGHRIEAMKLWCQKDLLRSFQICLTSQCPNFNLNLTKFPILEVEIWQVEVKVGVELRLELKMFEHPIKL
jgi:hypothetical protein